jgi:hypothetical protein
MFSLRLLRSVGAEEASLQQRRATRKAEQAPTIETLDYVKTFLRLPPLSAVGARQLLSCGAMMNR